MKRIDIRESLLTVALVSIVLAVPGSILLYLSGHVETEIIRFILMGLGPFGTVLLALFTYETIQQNQRNLSELQKDREKPIAADEIRYVIQPAIDALETDAERLEEGYDFSWVYHSGPSEFGADGGPTSLFRLWNPDRAAMKQLQKQDPWLYAKMEWRQELNEQLAELGSSIADDLNKPFSEYIHQKNIRGRDGQQPDVTTLIDAALKETRQYGESHQDFQIWNQYRQQFILMANQADELGELRRKEKKLVSLTEELPDPLIDRKRRLREEYGISRAEVEEDDDLPTR